MKIEHFRVQAFGRLAEWETGADPLPGLVVVYGPNEAGKTTLFQFLTAMLYGFHPASREGNPWAPWTGADASGRATLRLDGGGRAEIERRLLAQPSARLATPDGVTELRNRPVPWAEHVPLPVFRQVYALTLSEMTRLEEEAWDRVQDRILGAMGAGDLQPARRVALELEQEAGEIWRPSRRGNQRARDLARRLHDLRALRRDAVENDRRIREAVHEAERLECRLRETREARQAAKLSVERVQALVPIRAQLARIEALLGDAGDPAALEALPADPAAELQAREQRVATLRRALAALEAAGAEPTAALQAYGPLERRLVARADEVAAFLARCSSLAGDAARHAALLQEAQDLRRRLDQAAGTVLAPPFTDEAADAVRRVPIPELRERVRRLQAAREADRAARDAAAAAPHPTPPPLPWAAPAAVLAAAAVLAVVGLGSGGAPALAAAAAVALVGLFLAAAALRGRRRPVGPLDHGAGPGGSEQALQRARADVASLLGALPLLPSVAADPGEGMVAALERVQELLHDLESRRAAAAAIQERIGAAEDAARDLAAALERGAGRDAAALALILERDLRQAERAAQAAEAAERELRRLGREEERTRQELAEAEASLLGLRERLGALAGGDLEAGARAARDRLAARARADQLKDELERAHPDLGEIRARIRAAEAQGESWTVDEGDLARRRALVEELTHRVEDEATRAKALEKDLEQLRTLPTVDAVDGEAAAVEEEQRALLEQRDRLWLLSLVVREADRRFRDEHQPDLLRRAGAMLRELTGGRYDRFEAGEGEDAGTFLLSGPAAPAPVRLAPPLSRGTLEQAYLALRLAVVDHLDHGLERLPLFVDEVLVNWDEERRRHGMEVLARFAQERQVFVFTCHRRIADELAARGARVLAPRAP